jgi:putative transposase
VRQRDAKRLVNAVIICSYSDTVPGPQTHVVATFFTGVLYNGTNLMEYDLDSGAHSTYSLHYHLILTTKYRRGVLTEERTQFIRGVISGFTDKYGVELTNLDGEDDHVHILFRAKPTTDLVKFINTVKGATARRIRNEYEDELKTEPWGDSFWNDSYCLISTGQVSLDVLKQYVEDQRES